MDQLSQARVMAFTQKSTRKSRKKRDVKRPFCSGWYLTAHATKEVIYRFADISI